MPKKGYKQTEGAKENSRNGQRNYYRNGGEHPRGGTGKIPHNKGKKGISKEISEKLKNNSYKKKIYLIRLNGSEDLNWKNKTNMKIRREIQEKIAGRLKPEYCEVCGRSGTINFDHNHTTGKFRGWLCRGCNLALGFVGDNKEIFEKLIIYLETNK